MNKNNILLGIVVILVIALIAWPKLSGRKNMNTENNPGATEDLSTETTANNDDELSPTISVTSNTNPNNNTATSGNLPHTNPLMSSNMSVYAFFGNSVENPSSLVCEAVYPVKRNIPRTQAVARAALEQTLRGVNADETIKGYYTSINEGTVVNNLRIERGVAYVDLNINLTTDVAGTCRTTTTRAQITETLKQFSNVTSVVISVNGQTEGVLQP